MIENFDETAIAVQTEQWKLVQARIAALQVGMNRLGKAAQYHVRRMHDVSKYLHAIGCKV